MCEDFSFAAPRVYGSKKYNKCFQISVMKNQVKC